MYRAWRDFKVAAGLLLLSFLAPPPPTAMEISGAPKKEAPAPPAPKTLGTEEVERADGGRDRIYFSTMSPEEEKKNKDEEKEKAEKSLDLLKNIIIDRRPP
jgi:hypothetical protein